MERGSEPACVGEFWPEIAFIMGYMIHEKRMFCGVQFCKCKDLSVFVVLNRGA